MLCALQSTGIQIAASVLFEGDAKAVGIQLATFSHIMIDRPKSRNEQNPCAYVRHIAADSLSACRSSELRASPTTNRTNPWENLFSLPILNATSVFAKLNGSSSADCIVGLAPIGCWSGLPVVRLNSEIMGQGSGNQKLRQVRASRPAGLGATGQNSARLYSAKLGEKNFHLVACVFIPTANGRLDPLGEDGLRLFRAIVLRQCLRVHLIPRNIVRIRANQRLKV